MISMTPRKNQSWIAGMVAAITASLCCITPVLAFLGGASGLAASFSWIEPFRPYLLALTVLIFAYAWYQKLRPKPKQACACDVEDKKSFWQSKVFLAIVTVLSVVMMIFPYYAGIFYPKAERKAAVVIETVPFQTAEFKIKGMTCEGCTEHVNSVLSKAEGVVSYETSYEKGISQVRFDHGKITIDSLASVINQTGYKVVDQTLMKH
jgi:copper chaperone CopZ